MSTQLLNQYNISFRKTFDSKSNLYVFNAIADDFNLGTLITLYEIPEEVEALLNAIDLALNGHFDQIGDTDYGKELGLDVYEGYINADMTLSVYHENDLSNLRNYPLTDIKAIFESWLEFIQT